MERDENHTHARLKERRKTLLEPTICAHRGNILKLTAQCTSATSACAPA